MPYFEREHSYARDPRQRARALDEPRANVVGPEALVEIAMDLLQGQGASAVLPAVGALETPRSCSVPVLSYTCDARTRGSVSRTFKLENDGAAAFDTGFSLGELSSEQGYVIPRAAVSIRPAIVRVEPGSQRELTLSVDLPAGVQPGCYAGVLRMTGCPGVHAVLEVQVV